MPTPENRLDQLEPLITEVLIKQDELAAQLNQQAALTRRQNAGVLNQLGQQQEQISQLHSRMDQLDSRMDKLENAVEQGFIVVNQRMTDIFTLLSDKLK